MRFLRLLSVICLSFAMLDGLAAFYGRTYPTPNRLQNFGLGKCSGQLCFSGVIPGTTSLEDAARILAQHGAVQPPTGVNLGVKFVVDDAYIDFDGSMRTVMHVSVFSSPDRRLPVSVGDVLSFLGTPCGLGFDADRDLGTPPFSRISRCIHRYCFWGYSLESGKFRGKSRYRD
jgi:hypothetical protein